MVMGMVSASTLRKIQYLLGIVLVVVLGIHLAFRWPSYEESITYTAAISHIQAWDFLYAAVLYILLYAALTHGLIGFRTLLLELWHWRYARVTVDVVLIIIGVVVAIVGTIALTGTILALIR
jgi:succinate dehydrogenase / fumarate reductase membrane anchor subunit